MKNIVLTLLQDAKNADFIVTSDGVAVPKSQSRMREGFDKAGFPTKRLLKLLSQELYILFLLRMEK